MSFIAFNSQPITKDETIFFPFWHTIVGHTYDQIKYEIYHSANQCFGLLICTLISENQGLEKLDFFQSVTWIFFRFMVWYYGDHGINLTFFSRWRPRKKVRFAETEIFLRLEADLDFSRLWFSEIKVQIKRPNIPFVSLQDDKLVANSLVQIESFLRQKSSTTR